MPHVPCVVENIQWRNPFPKEVLDKWQSSVATLDDFVSGQSVFVPEHSTGPEIEQKRTWRKLTTLLAPC